MQGGGGEGTAQGGEGGGCSLQTEAWRSGHKTQEASDAP